MNITITGSSGFVGQNLISYLQRKGYSVNKLCLRNDEWYLRNDTDVVIHLAGIAHDTSGKAPEMEYIRVNTMLTKKVFMAFLDSNAKYFFYFSSVKAAADKVEGLLYENIQPNPHTFYGKSKYLAEQELLSQALPHNKRLFIIRPCMIHGPGNKGNLNLLYKIVQCGIPWPLAAFENKRSFLSIDNLNFLLGQMLTRELPSGIYNFADDEPVSTNRLVHIIADVLGTEPKLWRMPKKLISFAAKTGDRMGLPLNTERLAKLTETYVVSNRKIKEALKISVLPVSASEGLKSTIKSFKKQR